MMDHLTIERLESAEETIVAEIVGITRGADMLRKRALNLAAQLDLVRAKLHELRRGKVRA